LLFEDPVLSTIERDGGSAPDLASAGEGTYLRYPLRARSGPTLLEPGILPMTVERLEILSLPIGQVATYRLRAELSGPSESMIMTTWIGVNGIMKVATHYQGQGVDLGHYTISDISRVIEYVSVNRGPSPP
jgi:hypothetical protein